MLKALKRIRRVTKSVTPKPKKVSANLAKDPKNHVPPMPASDKPPEWARDVIDEVENWGSDFSPLYALAYRKWLDDQFAPIKAIEDEKLAIAIEGEELIDKLHAYAPDLIDKALRDEPYVSRVIDHKADPVGYYE